MKKILSALLFLCLFSTTLSANAFSFSNLFKRNTETSTVQTADYSKQISSLDNKLSSADVSLQTVLLSLVSMLQGQEATSNIQSKINSATENVSSETVKSTLINEILTAYVNQLKNDKQSVVNSVKTKTLEEKAEIVNNIFKLAQEGKEYLSLAKDYTTLANQISQTQSNAQTVINNISSLKETAQTLTTNAQTVAKAVSVISSVLNAGGISFNIQ